MGFQPPIFSRFSLKLVLGYAVTEVNMLEQEIVFDKEI